MQAALERQLAAQGMRAQRRWHASAAPPALPAACHRDRGIQDFHTTIEQRAAVLDSQVLLDQQYWTQTSTVVPYLIVLSSGGRDGGTARMAGVQTACRSPAAEDGVGGTGYRAGALDHVLAVAARQWQAAGGGEGGAGTVAAVAAAAMGVATQGALFCR